MLIPQLETKRLIRSGFYEKHLNAKTEMCAVPEVMRAYRLWQPKKRALLNGKMPTNRRCKLEANRC